MEEKMIPGAEVKNPAHLLQKKLQENRQSLHIARIPTATKEAFKKLAEDEFCGDYGMALKWLIDDIPGQDTRLIMAKLEEHEARIQDLETRVHTGKDQENVETGIKMLDGSKKGVKK